MSVTICRLIMDMKQDCLCLHPISVCTHSSLCSKKSFKLLLRKILSSALICLIAEYGGCHSCPPSRFHSISRQRCRGVFLWKVISRQIKHPPPRSSMLPAEELVCCNKPRNTREELSLRNLIYLVVEVVI